MLLLSATPYKPFTYAEEAEEGGGHYADFLKTLEFLAASDGPVDSLRADLDELRQAALAGEPTAPIRDRVQAQLRRWIARTERPTGARRATTLDTEASPFRVQSDDFAGFRGAAACRGRGEGAAERRVLEVGHPTFSTS